MPSRTNWQEGILWRTSTTERTCYTRQSKTKERVPERVDQQSRYTPGKIFIRYTNKKVKNFGIL